MASLYTGTIPTTSSDSETQNPEAEAKPKGDGAERRRFDRTLMHQQSTFTIWGSDAGSDGEHEVSCGYSSSDSDGAFLAEAALEAVRMRKALASQAVAAFRGGPARKLLKVATTAVRTHANPFQRAYKMQELSDRAEVQEMADRMDLLAQQSRRFLKPGREFGETAPNAEFKAAYRTLRNLDTLQRANLREAP